MNMAKTVQSVMLRRRVVASAIAQKEKKLKKPKRAKLAVSVYGMRAKRGAIHKAADNRQTVDILYRKINGEVKKYTVEPYSYRSKRLRMGWRKLFFAYDVDDKSIKGFLLANILSVEINEADEYKPRWMIELGVGAKGWIINGQNE